MGVFFSPGKRGSDICKAKQVNLSLLAFFKEKEMLIFCSATVKLLCMRFSFLRVLETDVIRAYCRSF